jgi:hypothetical protein
LQEEEAKLKPGSIKAIAFQVSTLQQWLQCLQGSSGNLWQSQSRSRSRSN